MRSKESTAQKSNLTKNAPNGAFFVMLLLLLEGLVLSGNRVVLLELELICMLLLILSSVVDMTLADAFLVARRHEFYELIL